MKLVVFGATGRTGRHFLDQALGLGHTVTAFVRNPAALMPASRLIIQSGNVLNPAQVHEAVQDQDVVISALGGRRAGPSPEASPGSTRTVGTAHILAAMEHVGVRRFICESAYGVGEDKGRTLYARAAWRLNTPGFEDTERQEQAIKASRVDWIIVRPTRLTDEPKRGVYRVGVGLHVSVLARIGRADVADFMLKQVADDTYLRQTPIIMY